MTTLSPAAQAVLDAAFSVYNNDEILYFVSGEQHTASIAAVALRAAANIGDSYNCSSAEALDLIIAIAAELRGQ